MLQIMKKHLTTIILALCFGYLGGYVGNMNGSVNQTASRTQNFSDDDTAYSEDMSDDTYNNEVQLELVKYKVEQLEFQIDTLAQQLGTDPDEQSINEAALSSPANASLKLPVKPNVENLTAAGISADQANELMRRMSQQEYQRLELQNKIRRSKGAEASGYREELRQLNQNKISLRTELGDDAYDQYLYTSNQNNRVKISSVMSGSPAESSGFESNDIILSYDGQKILDWSDIRRATLEGEIGSYTNVYILRDGERMSLMVPRGTLGVQLEPVHLDPAE